MASIAETARAGLCCVTTLKLSPRLRRSLATTNAAESLVSRTRSVKRNVTRLVSALRARDRQLGLVTAEEGRQVA